MDQKLLERRIEDVEEVTGSGTAMVSLYISAGTNIASERQRMSQEKSEASNIKSKQNRKNVEKAISRVSDLLKNFKQTPENGLVLFVGVTEDGTEEFIFNDLPQKLEFSDYTCDNKFKTEPLREMVAPDQTIGLLVIERGGCAIGELRGTNIQVHYDENSNVMGKHNAGGQCLVPDTELLTMDGSVKSIGEITAGEKVLGMDLEERQTTSTEVTSKWGSTKTSYKLQTESPSLEITASGDHTVFVVEEDNEVQEVPVSDITTGDLMLYQTSFPNHLDAVQPESSEGDFKTAAVRSISKTGEQDLIDIETETGNFFANNLLVHNSAERFDRLIEEQRDSYFESVKDKLMDAFVDTDNQPTVDGFVVGGTQITVDNFISDGYLPQPLHDIQIGGSYSVDIANKESLDELVKRASDEIQSVAEQEEREYMDRFLRALHDNNDAEATFGEDEVQKAIEYGAVEAILISEDKPRDKIIEYEKLVENQGGELVIISDDFDEGEQFRKGFGGLGAILRYKIN